MVKAKFMLTAIHCLFYVHSNSGDVSEMVLLMLTTKGQWYVAYQIASFWIILSDFQGGLAAIASFLKCDFLKQQFRRFWLIKHAA